MDISTISQWSSVIGLAISLAVGIISLTINKKVNRLRKRQYIGVRLRVKTEEIKALNFELLGLHKDIISNHDKIKLTISKISSVLDQISDSVEKKLKNEIDTLSDTIRKIKNGKAVEQKTEQKYFLFNFNKSEISSDDIWDLYIDINSLSMKLIEFEETTKMFGQNG